MSKDDILCLFKVLKTTAILLLVSAILLLVAYLVGQKGLIAQIIYPFFVWKFYGVFLNKLLN